ncbi:MAG: penicillin-binding protein 2 [bacterium]
MMVAKNKLRPFAGLIRKTVRLQRSRDKRIMFLIIFLFLLWGLMAVRLFNLQVLNYGVYAALASGQHEIYEKLFPRRGRIFLRDSLTAGSQMAEQREDLYPIATNKEYNLVYAVPYEIADPSKAAGELVAILGLDKEQAAKLKKLRAEAKAEAEAKAQDGEEVQIIEPQIEDIRVTLLAQLSKRDDPYEPIKHKVDDEIVKELQKLDLPGIYFAKETFRYYPEVDLASHVLGFIGYKGDELTGRYGLEEYFNEELAGRQGILSSEKDAAGRLITVGQNLFQEAENGSDLVLTLDHTIQYVACNKLKEAVKWHQAESGTLIIMEPNTGAIIAMCDAPDFEPGNYQKVDDIAIFTNKGIYDAYESGSVFKPITMAAALDTNKVTPETIFDDTGPLKIDRFTIRNSDDKYHGIQTMVDVLDKSLNTGAIFVVNQTGGDVFTKYVKDFGFGSPTGIELTGELAGDISSLDSQSDIYYATASYGQGITVTPLQMAVAYSAIANGGKLVKPYIVDEIIKPDGQSIKTEPKVIRQVFSTRAATLLKGMLVSVVQGIHGKNAGVTGYHVAGKTGTAQIARKDTAGYEANTHIGTFVGFAPADNPRFVMLVRIVKPQGVQYAESSAAPLFGQIAKFLLNYYAVPPDDLKQ